MSLKRDVLQSWQKRAAAARSALQELEPRLAGLRYEYEILQRLQVKAGDEKTKKDWEIQVIVHHDIMVMTEHDLVEQEDESALCAAVIAEIEADLIADEANSPTSTP